MPRSDNAHHTLSVLVENQPGVLTRVSSLFARRAFNIESLAVGPTERPDRSCITIRVDCSDVSIDQVVKQLYKLVNVLKVNQMTTADAIERELMLVKVTASPDKRGELIHLAEALGCVGLRCETKDDVDSVIEKAMAITDVPVVIDFVVGHDAQVWPMVAAGASNDDILAARDVRPVFGDGQV